MRKLRILLVTGLALPLVALAASLGADQSAVGADALALSAPHSRSGNGAAGYRCCWVLFGGTWWCIPC